MLPGCVNTGERKGEPSAMAGPPGDEKKGMLSKFPSNGTKTPQWQVTGGKACTRARPPAISEYWFGHSCGDAYVKEKSHG